MGGEAHHWWWKQVGRSYVNRVLYDDWNLIAFWMFVDEYSMYVGTIGWMFYEDAGFLRLQVILGFYGSTWHLNESARMISWTSALPCCWFFGMLLQIRIRNCFCEVCCCDLVVGDV